MKNTTNGTTPVATITRSRCRPGRPRSVVDSVPLTRAPWRSTGRARPRRSPSGPRPDRAEQRVLEPTTSPPALPESTATALIASIRGADRRIGDLQQRAWRGADDAGAHVGELTADRHDGEDETTGTTANCASRKTKRSELRVMYSLKTSFSPSASVCIMPHGAGLVRADAVLEAGDHLALDPDHHDHGNELYHEGRDDLDEDDEDLPKRRPIAPTGRGEHVVQRITDSMRASFTRPVTSTELARRGRPALVEDDASDATWHAGVGTGRRRSVAGGDDLDRRTLDEPRRSAPHGLR